MIAERNFVTDDHSRLSFHKGDIIRVQVMDGLEKGEAARGLRSVTPSRAPLARRPGLCFTACRACVCTVYQRVCLCLCVCLFAPGFSYGCVVRKKVVFLEEMKRDTQEFGEYEVDFLLFWGHKETWECLDDC